MRTIRQSLRSLARQPGFAVIVILTSALGIGTATAVYSIVYAILLRPYPYADPDALVRVQTRLVEQGGGLQGCSLLDVEDYRRRATTIEDIGAYFAFENRIVGDGRGEVAVIAQLNPAALNILGVQPAIGRLFTPDEDQPGGDVHKALISDALWHNRFNADPDIVGRALPTDRITYTIVGVMPPGFAFPQRSAFWTPMESWYSTLAADRTKQRDARFYPTIARLKPGVTLAHAEADLNAVAEALAREYPTQNQGVRITLTPLRDFETGELEPYLRLLTAGVAFVVLICCANVAGLLLVRATGQRRQLAIQTALGASRARVIGGLLADALLLAAAGGALGVAFAYAGVRAIVAMIPVRLPFWMSIEIDGWVLGFSVLLTLTTGLLFGVLPAVQASRVDANDVLKEGARGSSGRGRLRSGLIVAEVALSVLLLVGAALLMQTLIRLQGVDPGFRGSGLVTARTITYQAGTVRESAAVLNNTHARILDALHSIPGVAAAAVTNALPFTGSQTQRNPAPLTIRGRAETKTMAPLAGADVSVGYFRTMQIPLVRGRLLDASDTNTSPLVVVINERAAKLLWPDTDPIGQDILWGAESPSNKYCRVVGVVADVRFQAAEQENGIELYYPITQWPIANSYYVVRTATDPEALGVTIRQTIESAAPSVSVAEIKTMERRIGESLWQQRLWGVMFTAFAALALALAAVGLYGVMSHSVAQRTREIGIRLAMGAWPSGVLRMVLREALALVAVGVVLGVAGALASGQLIASLLHGVPPHDPLTFAVVVLVLAVAALAAAALPAYRAARIDPTRALRAD